MRRETWYAIIAALAIGLFGYLIYTTTLQNNDNNTDNPPINDNDNNEENNDILPDENDRNNFDNGDTYPDDENTTE